MAKRWLKESIREEPEEKEDAGGVIKKPSREECIPEKEDAGGTGASAANPATGAVAELDNFVRTPTSQQWLVQPPKPLATTTLRQATDLFLMRMTKTSYKAQRPKYKKEVKNSNKMPELFNTNNHQVCKTQNNPQNDKFRGVEKLPRLTVLVTKKVLIV
ncbi:hypothetical protein DBV15_09016 [Temnothorax longispinosus]|uniref:Uncharacterized protein n=1 Tax=Temnothorax longispinosus TaxID=300112 RepID=A0A4S2KG79_9HYME|nr:hypothetical protein DBV15_09016 [Temnothorax longispinosus]